MFPEMASGEKQPLLAGSTSTLPADTVVPLNSPFEEPPPYEDPSQPCESAVDFLVAPRMYPLG